MSFKISVQPSGREFDAQSDETLLAAGLRQGIGLPYGCKDGACGSCKCKKISGSVVHGEHQAKALSADEEAQGFVLTCCATATSDVVLESRQVVEAGQYPIRKMPARVLSLDYVGALFASLLFPLVLVPRLGLHRTSLLIGLLMNAAKTSASATLHTSATSRHVGQPGGLRVTPPSRLRRTSQAPRSVRSR